MTSKTSFLILQQTHMDGIQQQSQSQHIKRKIGNAKKVAYIVLQLILAQVRGVDVLSVMDNADTRRKQNAVIATILIGIFPCVTQYASFYWSPSGQIAIFERGLTL